MLKRPRLPEVLVTSTDHAELAAARKRIAVLENELAIHRRARHGPAN
jgi:hypothetical protein